MKWRKYLINKLLKKDESIEVNSENLNKIADLSLQIVNLKRDNAKLREQKKFEPANMYDLARKNLGTFIPNFVFLSNLDENQQLIIGKKCSEWYRDPDFIYLINAFKQEVVNNHLFEEEMRDRKEYVLGAIDGIYMVYDKIASFGAAFKTEPLSTKEIDPEEKP